MSAPVKAFFTTESGERIDVHFNPAELTIVRGASWNAGQAKGRNAPELRFQGGQSGTLSMSLILDTTDTGQPVTAVTDKLLALTQVDPALPGADPGRRSARPPWVEFHWGQLHSFRAVLERISIVFTYFASSGMPLRAKADVTLKQWNDEDNLPLQNPTSGTPSPHTVHHLRPGETLDRVAARHYRDSTRWRAIAAANGIDDPMNIPAGTPLIVPELPVRRRG
jgi:nucleoid-associated protein YgaU